MSTVVHGGLGAAERANLAARGLAVLDLSASLNPYGPHPRVVAAARSADATRYPEAGAETLRAAFAAAHGLDPACVLAGNGSSELIYLVARAFLGPGTCSLVVGPAFGEYAAAAGAAGARVVEWRAPGPAYAPGLKAIEGCVAAVRPALVFVANPNNPTGAYVDHGGVRRLAVAAQRAGGRLVVDEAYGGFTGEPGVDATLEGVLVLRSLTKLHTIPGLRAGFLAGPAGDIAAVGRLQPPWAVGAPAAAAALEALRQTGFAAQSCQRIIRDRGRLAAALEAAGFRVAPSRANFLLVEVEDAPGFRTRLLEHGFAVRDCMSFGLPGSVRVAVPRAGAIRPLVAAMVACR